jgi:hypothetical protein
MGCPAAAVGCAAVSESEQNTGSNASAPDTSMTQPAEASTGADALKVAPTDNDWLEDMDTIRGSGAPVDNRVVYRLATEES